MNRYRVSRQKRHKTATIQLRYHVYVSYGYEQDTEGAKKSACRRFDEEYPDRSRVTEASCMQPDGTIRTVVVWV